MGDYRKWRFSPLDDQVFRVWEELAFRDGGFAGRAVPLEVEIERQRNRLPEWEAILAMVHDGREWRVGTAPASAVSHSIWAVAMLLGKYDLAETTIARFLRHTGPFDRSASAEFPIMLQCTRFVRDRSPEAARALTDLIGCGIYRPGVMARSIFRRLTTYMELFWDDGRDIQTPVSDEARALALALAVALRAGKRHRQAAERLKTWEEFGLHISNSAGWEGPGELANPAPPKRGYSYMGSSADR